MSSSTDVVTSLPPGPLRPGRSEAGRRARRGAGHRLRRGLGRGPPRPRPSRPTRRAGPAAAEDARLRQTARSRRRRGRSPRAVQRLDPAHHTRARRPGRPRRRRPPSRWPRPSSATSSAPSCAPERGPAGAAPRAGAPGTGRADPVAAEPRRPRRARRPTVDRRRATARGALPRASRAVWSSSSPTPACAAATPSLSRTARPSTPGSPARWPGPGRWPGMSSVVATRLQAAVLAARPVPTGRVRAVVGLVVHVEGLAAAVGELGAARCRRQRTGRAVRSSWPRSSRWLPAPLVCMPLGPTRAGCASATRSSPWVTRCRSRPAASCSAACSTASAARSTAGRR